MSSHTEPHRIAFFPGQWCLSKRVYNFEKSKSWRYEHPLDVNVSIKGKEVWDRWIHSNFFFFFSLPKVTRKKINNKKNLNKKILPTIGKWFRPEKKKKKKIGISKIKIRKIKSWNSQNRQHHVLPNSYGFSAENGRTDNTDSSAATLLPLACSSLWHFVLSKWRSMASVAGLWIWSNRDVHELRHALWTWSGGAGGGSSKCDNSYKNVRWHREDGEAETGKLSRDVFCGRSSIFVRRYCFLS